jgi:dTMP kinase
MPSDPSSFYRRTDPTRPVQAASAPRSAYAKLLGNTNFRYWFASSFTSSVGDWMGFVALTALMTQLFEETSSQLFAVSGLLMVRLLPSAMFGPISGVIADRYDRRKVLVFTDFARATIFLMIAFAGDLLAIFALTFIVECVSLLFLAAKDASLPQVVDEEDLTEANQLNLLCSYGTLPLGAVSTSAMIAVAGIISSLVPAAAGVDPLRLALVLNAVSFFLSGLLLFKVHLPGESERRQQRKESDEQPGIIAELRVGLDFIRGFPLLRALIGGIVGVFLGAGVVVGLGPVFVASELARPSADWSILLSVVGGGLVLGIVALVPLLRRFDQETVFPIMLALTGLLAAMTALSANWGIALAIGSLLGAAAGVAVVQGYTLLQTNTEDDTRARTFSLFYVLTRMSLFAALALGPLIAGAIGRFVVGTTDGVITVSGVRIVMVVGGLFALWSGLRARSAIAAARRLADRPIGVNGVGDKPDSGLFVTFEGVEGSGKSTQIRLLAERLREEGHEVVVTREPGGAPLAERIRELVLDPETTDMGGRTEALLIAAARADHVERLIKPSLEAGHVVLSDRFVDSSLAYQGYGRELGPDDVNEINRWAVDGVMPDAVVLLNLDPAEGLRRVGRRVAGEQRAGQAGVGDTDRIEREGVEFHRRVAKGFLDLARSDHDRFLIFDASDDEDSLHRQVRAALHRWVPLPVSSEPEPASSDEPAPSTGPASSAEGARPADGAPEGDAVAPARESTVRLPRLDVVEGGGRATGGRAAGEPDDLGRSSTG